MIRTEDRRCGRGPRKKGGEGWKVGCLRSTRDLWGSVRLYWRSRRSRPNGWWSMGTYTDLPYLANGPSPIGTGGPGHRHQAEKRSGRAMSILETNLKSTLDSPCPRQISEKFKHRGSPAIPLPLTIPTPQTPKGVRQSTKPPV